MASMNTPPHEIIQATSKDDIQRCQDIRMDVFHHEQKFPAETEIDDLDRKPETAHFLLRLKDDPQTAIGTIRGSKKVDATTGELKYYKLSRLAILKDYRQFKFGRGLVDAFHAWIYAKGFYAKSGYIEEGDEFDDDGAPHQNMVLNLKI